MVVICFVRIPNLRQSQGHVREPSRASLSLFEVSGSFVRWLACTVRPTVGSN